MGCVSRWGFVVSRRAVGGCAVTLCVRFWCRVMWGRERECGEGGWGHAVGRMDRWAGRRQMTETRRVRRERVNA